MGKYLKPSQHNTKYFWKSLNLYLKQAETLNININILANSKGHVCSVMDYKKWIAEAASLGTIVQLVAAALGVVVGRSEAIMSSL